MSEEKYILFLQEHENDDPERLLLSAARWPGIDVRRAARNIQARRKMREKVPFWHAHPKLEYPGSLPLEQCSSEITARYKQDFVPNGSRVADLTGGLGVDSWALAQRASEMHYCERNPELCAAARHNFAVLDVPIQVHEGDGLAWLREMPGRFDLIYLDPARRDRTARRVYDIADCEPDLLAVKTDLLNRAGRVLAKISPMADISRTLGQFPETRALHVVTVGGEVKELLLLLEPGPSPTEPLLVAVDGPHRLAFRPSEEPAAAVHYTESIGRYLFQPSKALLKAGAFRLLSERFGIAKLAPSTHLYTSDETVPEFPGKRFTVEAVFDWNKASIRLLQERFDRLELTALNFPLGTEALRARLGIAAGGDRHLFAATLSDKRKQLILCQP
jgi:hypothetical protein